MATTITCHCGIKFQAPPDLTERRVNCPTCGSVIFLMAEKVAGAEEEEGSGTYDLMRPGSDDGDKKNAGVEGIPDWLDEYSTSPNVKKADRENALNLIARLSSANATVDPLGTALNLATTHADAETSVAALVTVAMSGHPVYGQIALTFLDYIGPRDAGGAQQVVILLKNAKDAPAEQVLIKALRKLGPTPVVHVRTLIEVLESKHTALYIWALQCLKLIGPPAKRAVETLLKTLKIANHQLRIAVIDALGTIARDGEHVIPILLQALKHQSPDYRAHAAAALGHYGSAAAKSVAPLKELLKDQDPEVHKAVVAALQTIAAAVKSASGAPSAAEAINGKASEPIVVVCSCGKRLRVAAEHAGKKVKCPGCKGVIAVPAAQAPAAIPVAVAAPPAAPAAAPAGDKECTTCLATVPAAAVLCVQCGHNFRK